DHLGAGISTWQEPRGQSLQVAGCAGSGTDPAATFRPRYFRRNRLVMPRHSAKRCLAVWMNGEHVGTWTLGSRHTHEFAYSQNWLDSPHARPLSLSLPLQPASRPHRGPVVEAFFDNLLPDSRAIRQRIQSRFHVASIRAFDLLAEIGRDCVGAIQ